MKEIPKGAVRIDVGNGRSVIVTSTEKQRIRLNGYARMAYRGVANMAKELGMMRDHVDKMIAGRRNIPDWLMEAIDDYFEWVMTDDARRGNYE